MNYSLTFYAILMTTAILSSCSRSPLDVTLPEKDFKIEFINVDQKLHNQSLENVKVNVESLKQQLGSLFIYELSQNVRQNIEDTSYQAIYNFYNSDYISDLEDEKKKLFTELPKHQDKISHSFKYLNYHFNDSLVPDHIFYINKLFSQVSCSDNNIAVGLENYISPESEVIKAIPNAQLYQWQRERMNIEYLERDVLLNWIQVKLFKSIDSKLAEHIIQAGKILYVLNAAFPEAEESYILRYNQNQYEWANTNEKSVWNYLVEQQLLFQTDLRIRTNFLNEAPTTVGLSENAPDRIGQFLGYRIVKGYMSKNKALSLQTLLKTKYNTILQTYEIQ
ncbi:gliding motility lipoprotein GldB [Brumimicrobium mesophilum]|uniref:gliding motility lipoprotein GldB n=1 Tax=Brumimicrobium mesophilum TaxID=392717 RepID=UPI000D142BEE|nr:hypothetical protein [Brumimicrobium mesophilum]